MLHDLAAAPATAHHIADKLARHFVADTPPPALVDRLAGVFARHGRRSAERLSHARSTRRKRGRPAQRQVQDAVGLDGVVAARARLAATSAACRPRRMLTQLGQPVWRPGSPAGYDDIAASWAAPDALVRRVEAGAALRGARRRHARRARARPATCSPGRCAIRPRPPSRAPKARRPRSRCCSSRPIS